VFTNLEHDGDTKAAYEHAKQLVGIGGNPESPYFTFCPFDTFLDRPPKQWKIKNVCGEKDIVVIFGGAGSGKTFTVIDLIYAASQGKDWVGRWDSDKQWHGKFEIARSLTVAYCFGEGSGGLPARFRAAEQLYGKPAADVIFVDNVPQLYKGKDVGGIDAFIKEYMAAQAKEEVPALDLLIIDTQATATLGADENSSTHMAEVIANAQKAIKMLGCAIILIHHATKSGESYRGSSVLHGAADSMIEVEKNSKGERSIKCYKLKDGEPWEPQRFSLVSPSAVDSVYVSWDGATTLKEHMDRRRRDKETIKQLLQDNPGQRFTGSEVNKRTKIATTTAKRILTRLAEEGFAVYEETKRGKKTIESWYFDSAQSG
jgi:hypothetical protein